MGARGHFQDKMMNLSRLTRYSRLDAIRRITITAILALLSTSVASFIIQHLRRLERQLDDSRMQLDQRAQELALFQSAMHHYQEVIADRTRLKAIVDRVSSGIMVLNAQYVVTMLNPAAANLTGWAPEQALGTPCAEILRCHDERNLSLCGSEACPLQSAISLNGNQLRPDVRSVLPAPGRPGWPGTGDKHHTVLLHRPDGQHVWVEMVCSQLVDEAEPSFLCTLRDISEFRQLEKLKSEFIANVSHELRSPLTIIRGYSQILERALGDNEELLYYATAINDESRHLARLVDDLLDFSRIEEGHLRLSLEWCDLTQIVLEMVKIYEGYAKGHAIHANLPSGPLPARADPARVRQVLTNLINNAIKYSPEGTQIEVTLTTEEEDHKRFAHIRVRDEGPGIAPEHQQRIFERFYRVNTSPAGGEGLGLGLAVSKAIVDGHGGQIWVESKLGQGSTFHFTLPLPALPSSDVLSAGTMLPNPAFKE